MQNQVLCFISFMEVIIIRIIQETINNLLTQKDTVMIAIDGPCTSGKTTLAQKLSQLYDCNVFHMDDFFLRPEQRTPERYAEIGGNVDYERFREEVLRPLKTNAPFSYHPFDCRALTLTNPVSVIPKKLNIIEGSYSHHPYFGNPYDLKILLTVTPELQRQRILERPAFLHQKFFTEWIPMEQAYIQHFQIQQNSDIVL